MTIQRFKWWVIHYYLNGDGSLITDVFSVDSAWKGKKMRIFVNLKGGVDNVTFMGYYKGSYSVPLKTVVNSSSKNASVRRNQIRGKKGRGYWYLGVTNRSRQRWFVYTKTGGHFYQKTRKEHSHF